MPPGYPLLHRHTRLTSLPPSSLQVNRSSLITLLLASRPLYSIVHKIAEISHVAEPLTIVVVSGDARLARSIDLLTGSSRHSFEIYSFIGASSHELNGLEHKHSGRVHICHLDYMTMAFVDVVALTHLPGFTVARPSMISLGAASHHSEA